MWYQFCMNTVRIKSYFSCYLESDSPSFSTRTCLSSISWKDWDCLIISHENNIKIMSLSESKHMQHSLQYQSEKAELVRVWMGMLGTSEALALTPGQLEAPSQPSPSAPGVPCIQMILSFIDCPNRSIKTQNLQLNADIILEIYVSIKK